MTREEILRRATEHIPHHLRSVEEKRRALGAGAAPLLRPGARDANRPGMRDADWGASRGRDTRAALVSEEPAAVQSTGTR